MSYNLTTMQSIYHNQDEIVEITYNNSPVYQKSGPTPPSTYDIRYTTTDNQQLTLSSSTGVVSHTFENNTGYITLDSNKEVPNLLMVTNMMVVHHLIMLNFLLIWLRYHSVASENASHFVK